MPCASYVKWEQKPGKLPWEQQVTFPAVYCIEFLKVEQVQSILNQSLPAMWYGAEERAKEG